ncbi:MAG: ABC transporter ATP-binding protein [Gemmatimonadetes bacterium]|nr:ABC transporter ATP-binding protein [Gemmatimonadota bacterium]
MSAAVEVRDLTRRFGGFTAVDRVSFEVGTGEIFGFLGPNGAGKTTTLKMLTGLLPPTSGEAVVAGVDVAQQALELRARIGYMSQKFSLYGDLTVDENLELFAGLYGVTGERFARRRAWALHMAGIEGQERRLTAELPLGWKQRLALGCAVLHEPPLLFLDEPTSGVDPMARRAFWDLIYELAAGGTTVLVSTHYMEEAEYCHRLLLMHRGRIIAQGRPAELRGLMAEPIYSFRTDHAPQAVEALQHAEGVREAALFGRDLHVVLDPERDEPERVRALLAAAGHAVHGIEQVEPSLEDVFVALVRREGGAVTT